jgi:carboxyl-terminal processing protease
VAALLEGERGSAVELGLGGRGGQRSARLTRDLVVDVAVEAELAPGGVALIRVAQFSRRAGAELDRALSDAALYGPSGPRALVLDLRDNPGGLMEEAVAMLDRLMGQGPLVETIGRAASANEVWTSKDEPTDFLGPVVVLINGGSASAAEVVAGVLQDRKRAKLIGTRTYGKGSVQQLYELQDGSALKLTQARYRLPSGRFIEDRDGLVPEISIALPGEQPPAAALEARIRALPMDEAERAAMLTDLARLDGPAAAEAPVPREGSLEERLAQDAQLARALEEVASP